MPLDPLSLFGLAAAAETGRGIATKLGLFGPVTAHRPPVFKPGARLLTDDEILHQCMAGWCCKHGCGVEAFLSCGSDPGRRRQVDDRASAIRNEALPINPSKCPKVSRPTGGKLTTQIGTIDQTAKLGVKIGEQLSPDNQTLGEVGAGLDAVQQALRVFKDPKKALIGSNPIGSVVLSFEQGTLAGVASLVSHIAYFDPEPISRAILQVVGFFLGSIFAHHAQQVAKETRAHCALVPAVNEALGEIERAVMEGRVLPDHGGPLLDHLWDEWRRVVHAPGQDLYRSSYEACNDFCGLEADLLCVISKKKNRYSNLTTPADALETIPLSGLFDAVLADLERKPAPPKIVAFAPPVARPHPISLAEARERVAFR